MKISSTNPLPHVYAELQTVRHFELGKLRESISAECSRAALDEDYMEALAKADEGVAAAQALQMRASDHIHDHFTRDRALT